MTSYIDTILDKIEKNGLTITILEELFLEHCESNDVGITYWSPYKSKPVLLRGRAKAVYSHNTQLESVVELVFYWLYQKVGENYQDTGETKFILGSFFGQRCDIKHYDLTDHFTMKINWSRKSRTGCKITFFPKKLSFKPELN